MVKITIPYKPRNWSKTLHNCILRWMVLVLHRRAGKTTAVLNHLQRDALKVPNSHYAYIAPTYKQAKRIAWKMIKEYSRCIPGIVYNESDLIVTYPNHSSLSLYGSESVDSLRGIGLWGVGLDENSQQPSDLFSTVISKCLADHLGYCIWLGTPKGKNEFHRTYKTAQKNPETHLAILKTIDDSLKDESGESIDNLKIALGDDRKLVELGEMTQEEFDQEWYCSFEAAIKGAYYTKNLSQAHTDGRITAVPYDETAKVHTVWDLGVGTKMSIGFYQRIANELHKIDYWEGKEKDGIPQAVKALQLKPYVYGKHFAPHDINTTEIASGKTRRETAEDLGIKFEDIPRASIDDGINSGRLAFSRLWIDKNKCELWLDYIAQYRQDWDEKRGMFLNKPRKDFTNHAADEYRYASLVEEEMTNEDEDDYKQEPYKGSSIYEGDEIND